ncbi:hypothetical protein H312_03089 [Anncaliia algerae PRA339]|uniref:ISXO2-like transposase domain-containing protein n=1 Tax=Anncaliia algerae PRA339 TaxID=1288291 RepID=A0A059EXS8_9MICR|nr:hypothetical protein H312_03089 [Anncaliia algerae PRA339]
MIPNRKAETLAEIFSIYLKEGTILKTDGYPSYPNASAISNFEHKIVNHNKSFVAIDGTHTNLIECVWSHFKTLYRSKHGLYKHKLVNFIAEFN